MTMPHLHAALSGTLDLIRKRDEDSMFLSHASKSSGAGAGPLVTFVLPSVVVAGAEIVNACLARELMRRGFRVEFFVSRHDSEASVVLPPGAGYIVAGARQNRDLLAPLIKYLRSRKPAILIGSMWSLTTTVALAHHLAGSPARLCLWEHSTLSIQYAGKGWLHRFILEKSLRFGFGRADVRVAVSQGVAKDLARLSNMRSEEFSVIYNPLTLRGGTEAGLAEAQRIWGPREGARILSVGRLKSVKNFPLLVRAFAMLARQRDARLLLLGEGPCREEIAAAVAAEGVADRVIMPGQVADPTPFYKTADLFVLSSNREGFGNVILEALSCGLPVVSTNCESGPAEILECGRFGRLTPVGDAGALAAAMDEELTAEHDREALKRRAADFSPERITDQFLRAIYPEWVEAADFNIAAGRI